MSVVSFALDTSVLVRLLVGQPEPLYRDAARFVREQTQAGVKIHVGDMVVAEAYFALQSFYQIPKADALEALALFATRSGISLTPAATEILALPGLANANPGFIDRLIHGEARSAGHILVTFEKAARKLPATSVLLGED